MAKHIGASARRARTRVAVSVALGWLAGLQPAGAQDSRSVTVDLGECVDLESAEERFACYEARVEGALNERNTAPATAEREGRSSEPASGPAASAQPRADTTDRAAAPRADQETERREIVSTIAALREREPNSYLITLENGQVWLQVQPEFYPMRIGQRVTIYASGWGKSYRLSAADLNRFIQVERVR